MQNFVMIVARHWVVSLLLASVIVMLAVGFWPQASPVEVAVAHIGPMQVTLEEEGRTRLRHRYLITAPVAGMASRVTLRVGDPVVSGQPLLDILPLASSILDPRSRVLAEADVAAAKAALQAAAQRVQAAQAALVFADNELARLRALLQRQLIAADEVEHATMEATRLQAEWRSAKFQVEVAQYELQARQAVVDASSLQAKPAVDERLPIVAPITGRVLRVEADFQRPVMLGEPLLEVGDPTALEVAVDLLSADAVGVKPGMAVLLQRWGGDAPLAGQVTTIEPIGFTKVSALGVEEQRVWVIVAITSPAQAWERLGDGYRVEAAFVLWQSDAVLQVPASSLFRYQDGWAVFGIEAGRAVRRLVVTGQRNGRSAQVLAGISAGETIVDHPAENLQAGTRVEARVLEKQSY